MSYRANDYPRHQQTRGLRCDAARWVRPDAAKFLKPGTEPADIYPALRQQRDARQRRHERDIAEAIAHERMVLASLRTELAAIKSVLAQRRAARKYSEDQPRVPAGNGRESGRWSDASYGNGDRPRVYITRTNPDSDETGDAGQGDGGSFGIDVGNVIGDVFGGVAREIDKLDLFDIKPKNPRSGGVRLAGDLPQRLPAIVVTREKPPKPGAPGIGHNGGPPLDKLPPIPPKLPDTRGERMDFVRAAARAIGFIGRRAPIVDTYLSILEQLDYLKMQTDMIRTANDPPRALDELQGQIGKPGYQRHHIAEEAAARDNGFSENLIQGTDNLAGIPTLKHIEISKYYSTKTEREDGTWRSLRDDLLDADFDTRRQVGLSILKKYGVLQ